jgi:beta-glucosidase
LAWKCDLSTDLKHIDLNLVSAECEPIVAEGAYTVSIGGGQPDTGVPAVTGSFHVMGGKTLAE